MTLMTRLRQHRYVRRLRPMTVGRWTECLGTPLITATDAVAGDAFRVHSLGATTVIKGGGRLRFGDDVYLNSGVRIVCRQEVTIGSHVLIGFGAVILDSDQHPVGDAPVRTLPVRIGDGSWIAANAIILPGVTVGRRSIVGAGSVVTGDVPDEVVVAGNPARVVRQLSLPPDHKTAFGH
ncbi:acetyltransferase-like isoleucine patch superfamily enzyme [Microbacterium thalassium]|uniref:Acetyltransferase-like isoleucine patch superfamily enzyme n=2 Tax=Microbacterium thalassium TaxID=362649 RepID=A0A7X0FQ32_9MICO|nr:acetyltransferase-like isoleucine patch superfamily enzyme [Microbacterium thalassium]